MLAFGPFDVYAFCFDNCSLGLEVRSSRGGKMLRSRSLILVGGCLLASSAAWADGVGYIDCRNHPDDTEVFAKPRKTPDMVASVHCGERFYILQYGFIFSRIQTGDGKVGYIYSNLIAVDTSGVVQRTAPVQPQSQPAAASAAPAQAPAPSQSVVAQTTPQPSAVKTVAPEVRTPAQPASTSSPSTTPAVRKAAVSVAAPSATTTSNVTARPAAEPQVPIADSNAASTLNVVLNPDTGVPTSNVTQPTPAPNMDKSATMATRAPANPRTPKAEEKPYVAASAPASSSVTSDAQARPAPAASVSAQISVTTSNAPDSNATVAQPDTSSRTEPEPTAVEAPAPPIRSTKDSWERPNPGGRRAALIELFGGYSYARMVSAGATTNLSGGLGSIGWNVTSWLQLVADTSYNVVTASGAKNVLYGNHWGPRIFHRGRNRWNMSPFLEGLFGGSRSDTTVAGAKTSVNTFSIKAGGGLDIKPSRHLEIRLIDVDYYRTNFGGGSVYQNNYWASAGIVLRLFGRGEE
jgi:hypothetical protein